MRTFAFSVLALGFGIVGIQLSACSNSADDCNATATCNSAGSSAAGNPGSAGKSGGGSGNDAGNNGGGKPSTGGSQSMSGTTGTGGEGGGSGTECNGDVADDPTCWTTNELGVFVSSDAADSNGDGTKEAPFKTISQGIAAAAGKNVYVCLGIEDFYDEKLTITDVSGDGVHIYGGFECAGWTHSKTRYAGVASLEPTALRIQDLKKGVVIENVRFVAANGTATVPSSFGALITESKNVVLRRVELTAGVGRAGATGDGGVKGENGSAAGLAPVGSDACEPVAGNVTGGKWTAASACGSRGGPGGTGDMSTATADSGNAGIPTEHVHPLSEIDNGGPGEGAVVASLNGMDGTAGDVGDLGAAAEGLGTLSATGYAPAHGAAGKAGYPGQGGGGGGAAKGSASCFGASGGAGGMGGCGGAPGLGGKGGGASIGLLAWNSDVTLVASKITSDAGGAGGNGGVAGAGGSGANGGSGGAEDGISIKAGGNGGKGGTGGVGGSGSGGTGGPSYAIAYAGTKPTYSELDTQLTVDEGGEPGKGGQLLDAKAPDGAKGDSKLELEVK